MEYICSGTNQVIDLSEADIYLLVTISNLGYVTANQLDMLYSVATKSHKRISQSLLKSWLRKGAPLNRIDLTKYKVGSKNKVAYTVSLPFKKWAVARCYASQDLLNGEAIAVNDHNIQAIEVVVQALYTACFG